MNTLQTINDLADLALNPDFRPTERALLHTLLQATDYGVLVTGLDRQDILANRRFGELFDVVPERVVRAAPDAVRRIAHARVREPEAFDEAMKRAYADPMLAFQDEITLQGQPSRTLRRDTTPLCNRDGLPIARLWTFLDITETKRLQAEVKAQLAARTDDVTFTSSVLATMNCLCRLSLYPMDRDAMLTEIVICLCALAGIDSVAVLLFSEEGQEAKGMVVALESAPAPITLPCPRQSLLHQLYLANGLDEEALQFRWRGGSALAQRLNCSRMIVVPLRSETASFGALALARKEDTADDLSGNPARQSQLLTLIDQVALTLRTHRLQGDLHSTLHTLQTTQQRLVEIEKLRMAGTVAASIAHDIRNILTAMYMELMNLPEDSVPSLLEQVHRFDTLTHRLLAFARPNVLEMQPTQMADVLHCIVPLIAGQAEISAVEIDLRLPEDLPTVAADASHLEHLFVNLCLNAIQSMTERGGRLTLTGKALGEWTQIVVEDTGCGIAPDVIERLFDPFFTTRATGTGLGLFSCKRIVEDHGGQITVESSPGKGASFTVMLPALRKG